MSAEERSDLRSTLICIAILSACVIGTIAIAHKVVSLPIVSADSLPAPVLPQASEPDRDRSTSPTSQGSGSTALRIFGWRVDWWALAWFGIVFALELNPHWARRDALPRFRVYVFAISTIALGILFWGAVVAARGTGIPVNYAVAGAAVLTIFVASGIAQHASRAEILRNLTRDFWLLATGRATWFAVAAMAILAAARPSASAPIGSRFVSMYPDLPRKTLPIDKDGHSVVVVRFIDYECPPCRRSVEQYTPVLARLAAGRPSALKVVTKDYPLETECNPYVKGSLHPAACEAAAAVRLSRQYGREREMEAWLWANQSRMGRSEIFEQAKRLLGVEVSPMYASLLADMQEDIRLGHDLGVVGTPTYFVNGVPLPFVPVHNFEFAIRYELSLNGRGPEAR